MAKLYFYYGAMGSCKTATLLTTAFNYEERGQSALILKPAIDKRDGSLTIRSRVGLERECILLNDFKDKYINDSTVIRSDVILVDEAQFASKEEIDFLSDIVDKHNIPVICYGLRIDFRGLLFEGSKRLFEIADNIIELKTMCWCGRKATFNARYDENGILRDGDQVLLGSNSKYTALCREHYKLGKLKK